MTDRTLKKAVSRRAYQTPLVTVGFKEIKNKPVWGQIVGEARPMIDRGSKKDAQIRWAQKMGNARDYMYSEHDFRLLVGSTLVGPVVRMLGKEAKKRNLALEGKFYKALNTDKPNVRLMRWVAPDSNRKGYHNTSFGKQDKFQTAGFAKLQTNSQRKSCK